LFLLSYFGAAHAITINELLKKYGKDQIIETIREKMHGSITIDLKGNLETVYGPPNQDLVNSRTIQHDIDKLGISLKKLDSIIQGKRQLDAKLAENSRKERESTEKLQDHFEVEKHTQKAPKNYKLAIEAHLDQFLENPKTGRTLTISEPKMLMLMNPMLDLKAGQIIFISKVGYQSQITSGGDTKTKNFIFAFRGEKIIRVKEIE